MDLLAILARRLTRSLLRQRRRADQEEATEGSGYERLGNEFHVVSPFVV
jgi:hypothetical protein